MPKCLYFNQSIKKGALRLFLWIEITQTNQELKFLAKSSSPLKWTKEYFRLTRFNGFELLARTWVQGCIIQTYEAGKLAV